MQQELRPLVRRLALQPVRFEDDLLHAGAIDDVKVVATLTAMGADAARTVTERLLRATVVDHLVVVGIAGGIAPWLAIGDVLVPERVVNRYTGEAFPAAPLGHAELQGTLSTSDELDNTDDDVAALLAAGVDAVDMETACIAEVCARRGVPWTAFRAISDRVGDERIDDAVFGMANADGSPNVANIVRFLVMRPHRVPHLVALAQDMLAATEAAARAAIEACRDHDFDVG
jgi:adenosylhomocysteine nucleosidase